MLFSKVSKTDIENVKTHFFITPVFHHRDKMLGTPENLAKRLEFANALKSGFLLLGDAVDCATDSRCNRAINIQRILEATIVEI